MKKVIALALAVAMVLSLGACSVQTVEATMAAAPAATAAPPEAPTAAPTEPPVVTEPVVTEEPADSVDLLPEATEPVIEEKVESKSRIGLVMIAGALTFLLAGAMIFRSVSRKNRY